MAPTQAPCLLVFCRKDLCEAKHEMQSVFKFGRSSPIDLPFDRQLRQTRQQINWQIYLPHRSAILQVRQTRWQINWQFLIDCYCGNSYSESSAPADHLPPTDHLTWHLQIYPPKMLISDSY